MKGDFMSEDLAAQINGYIDFFPKEAGKLDPVIDGLNGPCVFDRRRASWHITASAIILRGEDILLIRHPVLNKWLQPGGHIEVDEMPVHAAVREAEEETGFMYVMHPWHEMHRFPFDVDVHHIPANDGKNEPAHQHYDFRYLLNVRGESSFAAEHKMQWVNIFKLVESNFSLLTQKMTALNIISWGDGYGV